MNRNLDGSLLSIDDLRAIAVHRCGANAAKLGELEAHLHSDALFGSHLRNITGAERLTMFGRGELTLDSRTPSQRTRLRRAAPDHRGRRRPRVLTYSVDVRWTDRTRDEAGGYVTHLARVTVLADDDTEATLVAAQLAHAIRADLDPMILSTTTTDCIA